MKHDLVIGVLGGMGTYATIHLFRQYAQVFSAEKEWERPRIVIDNRCTMPSRVRAFLYDENVPQLVDEMAESMTSLMRAGCNRLILACNTSHLFLPQIYKKKPELETVTAHIINGCVTQVAKDDIREVFLLGSEGTIDSGIYQKALAERGINCLCPRQEEYDKIRLCIEVVKQDRDFDQAEKIFIELINRHPACILGCTELPILYEKFYDEVNCERVYDPLLISLKALKKEFDYE